LSLKNNGSLDQAIKKLILFIPIIPKRLSELELMEVYLKLKKKIKVALDKQQLKELLKLYKKVKSKTNKDLELKLK